MKRAKDFFTEEERERIRRAVDRAEGLSSGEIVPMIVDRSGHYTEFPLIATILVTFGSAVLLLTFRPAISAAQIVAVELLTFWLFFLIIQRFPRLWGWLIPERLAEESVRRRAEEAFFENRLDQTREKTGVLILLSLLERRVQLLADEGIHKKAPPQEWEHLVDQIGRDMREGQSCEAFCRAIEACGELLARYFPKKWDDTDELQNRLVAEK
jgi:putative membrane protein